MNWTLCCWCWPGLRTHILKNTLKNHTYYVARKKRKCKCNYLEVCYKAPNDHHMFCLEREG